MADNINFKVTNDFKKTTTALKSLSNAFKNNVGNSKAMNNAMNKMRGSLRNITQDANRASKSFNEMSTSMKMLQRGATFFVMNKLAQSFAGMFQSGMDAIEILNMFEVSMGSLAEETDKELKALAELSGLDLTNLRQATGTFTLLAKSMGMASNESTTLGINATRMALDLSSLFNIPIEQVMGDLRSGMIGQTETVYKYGLDLTEASLQQEALRHGITKSVRTMSQGEKMQLRMAVAMRQASGANGDFARTIEQPANQIRLLGENFITLGRTISSVFIPMIGRVVPYIRGFVMALTELFSILGAVFGIVELDAKNMEDKFGGVSGGIDDVTKSTGKLKKEMKNISAPFDELNAITIPTAGGGAGGGFGGIGAGSLEILDEYDSKLASVKQKADDIKTSIMEWLGFTARTNEETGEVTWELDKTYTNLEKIRDISIVIGAIWTGIIIRKGIGMATTMLTPFITRLGEALVVFKRFGIGMGLKTMFPWMAGFSATFMNALPSILLIAGVLTLMVGRIYDLWQNNEAFRKGVKRVGDLFTTVWGVVNDKILTPIGKGFKWVGEQVAKVIPPEIMENIRQFKEDFTTALDEAAIDVTDLLIIIGGLALLMGPSAPLGLLVLGFEGVSLAVRALGIMTDEEFEQMKITIKDKFSEAIEWCFEYLNPVRWIEKLNILIERFRLWLVEIIDLTKTMMQTWWDETISPWFTKEKWLTLGKGFSDGIKEMFRGAFNGAITIVESAVNKMIDNINKIQFDIPEWLGGGEFGFNLSRVHIPRLARGGMLDGGSVFEAGEGGKAELLGSYNNKTTVMPLENSGFVTAMYDAIYSATKDAMGEVDMTGSVPTITLDGEVIYRNQEQVKKNKGVNFGVPEFAR